MAHTPKNQSEKAILTARRAWCYLVLVLISFLCLFFFYVLIINSTRTHFEIQKGFSLLPGKSPAFPAPAAGLARWTSPLPPLFSIIASVYNRERVPSTKSALRIS